MTTTPRVTPHHRSFRGAHRTPLAWALVSAAALVLAAVWPMDSDSPSSLFALSEWPALPVLSGPPVSSADPGARPDTPGIATPQRAAGPGSRDPSLPVAAEALAGRADHSQEQPPTF